MTSWVKSSLVLKPKLLVLLYSSNMRMIMLLLLKWFSTYLENRSYYVKDVDDSVSHVVKVTSGVPQGSILGPVLFNLYFKDAEMIAKSHGFSVHSYADDMQCYFELGKNISIDFVSDKITSFLLEKISGKNSLEKISLLTTGKNSLEKISLLILFLIKSLPNLGTWALPNLFFIIKTRVTEVSLPKWSLGSPHSDFLIIWEPFSLFHNSSEKCAMIFLGSLLTIYPNI